jgi:hypothetical protein
MKIKRNSVWYIHAEDIVMGSAPFITFDRIKKSRSRGKKKVPRPSKSELQGLATNMSIGELASHYRVTIHAVYKWFRDYRIQRNKC